MDYSIVTSGFDLRKGQRGKEELVGLFKRLIRENIGAYATLIGKILPTQVTAALDVKITNERELKAEYARLGIPYEPIFDAPVPVLEIEATEVKVDTAQGMEQSTPKDPTMH